MKNRSWFARSSLIIGVLFAFLALDLEGWWAGAVGFVGGSLFTIGGRYLLRDIALKRRLKNARRTKS